MLQKLDAVRQTVCYGGDNRRDNDSCLAMAERTIDRLLVNVSIVKEGISFTFGATRQLL